MASNSVLDESERAKNDFFSSSSFGFFGALGAKEKVFTHRWRVEEHSPVLRTKLTF
jgi:hypothetical protein